MESTASALADLISGNQIQAAQDEAKALLRQRHHLAPSEDDDFSIRKMEDRQAVGAKTHDILTQFLVEAVTLSIAGGCAGIVLGIAASAIISRLAGWNTVVSMVVVMLAVFFSALVGISFGYYPARKAAYLNPIEALRAE